MPSFNRFHDIGRYAKRGVDVAVQWFGRCGFPDFEHATVRCGQNDCRYLVSAELLAKSLPGSVNASLQEPVLDGGQQVVGQHTKEDVRLCPVFQMMKNRPLHERTLHVPKCVFHSRE